MSSKLSGLYKDFRGYQYAVAYAPTQAHKHDPRRTWVILISTPEGNYCSHAHYTKDEIKNQISGMKKEN